MSCQRSPTVLTLFLLASLLGATDLIAQRGERRRRSRQAEPRQAPKPEAAPKKKKPKEKPTAYQNGTVHVGNTTVLRRATVLIQDDKILEVGRSVALPPDARVVDCSGKHVCPGFVIMDLAGVGAPGSTGKDESYLDGIDPFAPAIKRALAVGITSYLTTSTRSGSLPTGSSAVLKLVPESLEGVVVKEPAVHAMSVPLGPSGWQKLEETLKNVKKYKKEIADHEKKKAGGDKSAKPPRKPSSYDEIDSVLEGKTKLRISAGRTSMVVGGRRMRFGRGGGGLNVKQIREALRIAKALSVPVILDHATEAWILADEIAATGSSCILQPRGHADRDPKRAEKHGSSIHAAAILAEAGVPITVLPPGGMFGSGLGTGGILGRDLNTPTLDPCFAIRGGMDEKEALCTITLYPAMMLGVDERIGSLEEGKDADLLILDGDPLHYKTFVETAIVNGKVVYEKDKEPFYRHIRSHHSKQ